MRAAAWILLFGCIGVTRLLGQQAEIPNAEVLLPPSPQRLAALHTQAQRDGWARQVAPLRAAALRAYEAEKTPAAERWYQVYRWAALWALEEADFVPRWVQAVQTAKVGHPNMPSRVAVRHRPLGAELSPDLQLWLLGHAGFSAEFFGLLAPVDYVPRVFEILNELHRRNAARFKTYASLGLAIALVYDVPPPPHWPHAQVSAASLPRNWPPPADAFEWWIRQEQLGRMQHKLSRLGADDLKFVVDAAAPFTELEWAQGAADMPLNQLARAYSMVRYRRERLTPQALVWPGRTYTLREILTTGGICADQAYFASHVGKARGVPTLLVYGAGQDGRHAWFGYLDADMKWQLDAGRYAEQRFVTGLARDPQTWGEFSDHELIFVTDRFRELPAYRQSRLHAQFAEEYLFQGNARAAGVAARKSVNYEKRNRAGWEILAAAAQREGRDARTIETVLREAALAFQRYPDLEAHYVTRVAESLRARGETSAATEELRRIASKNRGQRVDLTIQQAADTVRRAIAEKPLPEQVRAYNQVMDTLGRGAGIAFYDGVVVLFVEHLMQLKQKPEALRALERARRTLKIEPHSQLGQELTALEQRVRDAR